MPGVSLYWFAAQQQTNHQKNVCRQELPLPHKTMLCDFYTGLQFTSISQHC